MQIPFDDLLSLLQVIGLLGAGIVFVYKLGAKLDRLSIAIEHLNDSFHDHEERIRSLEFGRVGNE